MNTLLPYFQGSYPPSLEFVPALIVGVLFGAALEVAGFGNAKNLAGQFYFHDMRVFKVMFTAIITAAVGVAILNAVGLLGIDLLEVPDTFLVPHIVGGFVLGAGFMISAYCPGTSIVGAASGKLDGLLTIVGVILGSIVFEEIYPLIQGFYESTARGILTFPQLLGVPFSVLVALLVVLAFVAFLGADKFEGVFAKRIAMPRGEKMTGSGKKALGAVFAVAVIAIVSHYAAATVSSAAASRQISAITPVELAQMLVEQPRSLYVVDLRKDVPAGNTESIPHTVRFDDIRGNMEAMAKDRTMVAYSQKGSCEVPAELLKYKGKLALLAGGYEAWKSDIMGEPGQLTEATPNGAEDRGTRASLHAFFTGAKVEAPAEASGAPASVVMPTKRRGGGCS